MDGSIGADFQRNHEEPAEARRKRIERQERHEEARQLRAKAKRYDDLAYTVKDADTRQLYANLAMRYIKTAQAMDDLNARINRLG